MKLNLDFNKLATQSNAVLGIRGSGKSYTATWLAEQFMLAKIPFVAFDPTGVWDFLKVPGKGSGFTVVVAGENGDLPLTPETAPEIVRSAMKANIPLVINLRSIKISKNDWKRIVESSIKILLHENERHGVRHIFIEEAAEFAPQQLQWPEQKSVYSVIESLSRMGRNFGLGLTLINQRAEQLNKAVLENCNRLFLHRQFGRRSLQALEEWIEVANQVDKSRAKEIVKQVPGLASGECFIMEEGQAEPRRVKIPEKQTLHPSEDLSVSQRAHAVGKAIDVGTFVSKLKDTLQVVLEEAKENDPVELKKRIRELEKQLKERKPEIERVSVLTDSDLKNLKAHEFGVSEAIGAFSLELDNHKRLVEGISSRVLALTKPFPFVKMETAEKHFKSVNYAREIKGKWKAPEKANGLCKLDMLILTVLAQNPNGLNHVQVALRIGYSNKSGHYKNTLSGLRSSGCISGMNDRMTITDEGLRTLGQFDPLPQGEEMIKRWIRELDGLSGQIISTVTEAYPKAVTAEWIAEAIGYSITSGHFKNTLSKLRTLGIIVGRNDGIKASDDFFE